jgi:hypothetical protein
MNCKVGKGKRSVTKIKILEVKGKQALCDIGVMEIWMDIAMLLQYGVKRSDIKPGKVIEGK